MDMPMKKKRQTVARQAAARGPLPVLPKELLDQLVKGPMSPAEVQDLMLAFNKAVIERAMADKRTLRLEALGKTAPDWMWYCTIHPPQNTDFPFSFPSNGKSAST